MGAGWIKLYRQLGDHPLWTAERFTRGQAWMDLLMLANFEPGVIRVRGIEIHLNRGDVGWSKLHLAKRWKWNRRTVGSFLGDLVRRKMIHIRISRLTTVISITNYETYQNSAQQSAQQSAHEEEELRSKRKNERMGKREKTALPCSFKSWLLGVGENGKVLNLEILEIFEIFLEQYERYRGETHPNLRPEQWAKNYDALKNHEIIGESLDVECAESMIRKYFETNFPNFKVDYHLDHFCTEGILMNRFFEECY